MVLDQGVGDVGATAQVALALGGKVDGLLLGRGGGRYSDCSGSHDSTRGVGGDQNIAGQKFCLNLFFAMTVCLEFGGMCQGGAVWASNVGWLCQRTLRGSLGINEHNFMKEPEGKFQVRIAFSIDFVSLQHIQP